MIGLNLMIQNIRGYHNIEFKLNVLVDKLQQDSGN